MTTVTQCVASRRSVRAYLDQAVPLEVLTEILEAARRSPSGSNLQPWYVYALAGAELDEFRQRIQETIAANPAGEDPEYDVYPKGMGEPYRSRKFKCGEDLYAILGIDREDKLGRLMQFAKNFELFGAPLGLFFCIDRGLGLAQWAHLGMYVQTVMLLAQERGLATCAQESWSGMHKTTTSFLGVPDHLTLYCGMSMGYADASEPINELVTDRAELWEFATIRGF